MTAWEDIAYAVGRVLEEVGPVLPAPLQAPAKVVGLVLRDAIGTERTVSADGRIGAASGAAASRESHFAGMREAIGRIVYDWRDHLSSAASADGLANEIMAEIRRRIP